MGGEGGVSESCVCGGEVELRVSVWRWGGCGRWGVCGEEVVDWGVWCDVRLIAVRICMAYILAFASVLVC